MKSNLMNRYETVVNTWQLLMVSLEALDYVFDGQISHAINSINVGHAEKRRERRETAAILKVVSERGEGSIQ